MPLLSGKYVTKAVKEVIVWPAPDANGDGAEVWKDQQDEQGRNIGRIRVKDSQGNPVFHYKAPKGFENRPGYDHTDNWVLVSERGEIVRQPNGEAVIIKPGQALILEPNGSVSALTDEYEQYQFEASHDAVSEETGRNDVKEEAATSETVTSDTPVLSYDELVKRNAELEAILADKVAP